MEEELRWNYHYQNIFIKIQKPQIISGKEDMVKHRPERIKINDDPDDQNTEKDK